MRKISGIFLAAMVFVMQGCGRTAECPAGFIHKHGARLCLDGKEYREIGLNIYQILHSWYLEREEYKNGKGVVRGGQALDEIGKRNFKLIRFMAGPFWPAEYHNDFFDNDFKIQKQKRERFFNAFDKLLNECDRRGIKVVISLIWNLENFADLGSHSLREGLTDFKSPGYKKCLDFTTAVVKRYSRRQTVAWWEIGNEYDLLANRYAAQGVIGGPAAGDILRPWPVYRGVMNNFTGEELDRFFCEAAKAIKSLDKNHLITTGTSQEFPFHGGRMKRKKLGGFKAETLKDHAACVRDQHRCVDIISIHHYLNHKEAPLEWYGLMAKEIGKPLFIGEIGPHFTRDRGINGEIINGGVYGAPEGAKDIQAKLEAIKKMCVSATTFWTYGVEEPLFRLQEGATDEALTLLENANVELKKQKCE